MMFSTIRLVIPRSVCISQPNLSCSSIYAMSSVAEATATASDQTPQATTKKIKPISEKRRSSGKKHVGIKIPIMNIYDVFGPLRQYATAKFDETVEIAVKLAVDPRKPNQSIKSVAKLPFGTGKKVRVAVFATGEDVQIARDAGADVVGSDDLIKSIQSGDINFDRIIATPEMMGSVGKIGKILGPKGLMPNPKLGTVTKEVAKAVKAAKQGNVQFRVEKAGIIHAGIGKMSFSNDALMENVKAFMLAVSDARPEGFKGKFIESVHICSTMGPGLPIEVYSVDAKSPRFFLDPVKFKPVN